MANYDIVAFELVNQVRSMDDADEEDWVNLFRYNVLEIIPLKDWNFLPMRGQLALASTIVGTRSVAHFDLAFRMMCEWSIVGGCYWLAQLELIRLFCLHTIRMQLSGPEQTHLDPAALKVAILNTLPVEPHAYNTHPKLRLKMALLRSDLFWLLDKMADSSHPHEVFTDYHASFKLCFFVPWFLSWTLRLLVETEDCFEPLGATVTALLRSRGARRVRKTHIGETKCGECEGYWECGEEVVCSEVGSGEEGGGDDDSGSGSDGDSSTMYSACSEGITDAPAPSTIGEVCNAITNTTLTCVPVNNDTTTTVKRKSSDVGVTNSGVKAPLVKKQRTADVAVNQFTVAEADKENQPTSTLGMSAVVQPIVQATTTYQQATTTPERPPFRDLRIVTDPAQLRYLEQLHYSSGRGRGSAVRGGDSSDSSSDSSNEVTYTVMIKPTTNIADDYNSSYYANHTTHGTTDLTNYLTNNNTNNANTNSDEYSYYTNATRQDYASALLDEFNSHTHTSTHSNTPANTPISTPTSSTGTSTTMNTNTTSNHTIANPTEHTHTHTHTTTDTNTGNNTNTTDTLTTSTSATILQQLVHSVWEVFSPNNQEPTPMDTTDTTNTTDTTKLPIATTNNTNTTSPTNHANNTTMTSSTSRASMYTGSSMGSLAYSDTTNNSLPVWV